jgi:outer membrane lipoprotein-sorting protein
MLMHAADPISEIFSRMDTAAKNFKGMTADLTETVHVEIVDDNNVSKGTIKLRRAKPGAKPVDVRFLVEFTSPDPRAAAYSGNEVHLYNPKTNVEQIYDVAAKKSVIEQLMLLGFGATSAELKATYDVSFVAAETVEGQPAQHIRLVPKSKDMLAQLKQADLWISDSLGVPVQQKFQTTKTGDYNLFQYRNLKLEPAISDGDLKLKTPKNAEKKRVGAGSSK